ncbi:Sbal_3080 family lipoprotein [Castellaniella caeni]|uniref:Sbal_3080 family lipoprotein n=1 Tax=Castellaniella caeni TaxID=266123 RepID=UPI000832B19E|nr:Sbal_3080 family lipoprotein [Castellaniella caeni]
MANMHLLVAGCAVASLTACTAITVTPVDRAANLRHVCIQLNPKVQVSDFVDVVRSGFDRHGITTEVFSGDVMEHCEYVMTYTARRSWDFVTYLVDAELWIRQDGRQVAYAQYHLKGKGGFALNKWAGTKSKMDPVIDQLLASYR